MVDILQSVREDDFVEYYLFPKINSSNDEEQESELNKTLQKCKEIVDTLIKDHLWHKDPFKLSCRPSVTNTLISLDGASGNLYPHLYGVTHYGEYIEDEWFIVFILIELTRRIPGLIGKVCDSDGEFLLIEAADFLPTWANPETCENRVYIVDGKVHIIEPENMNSEGLEINEAIVMIRERNGITEASTDVQKAILERVSGYPNKIKENQHRAKAYVPAAIAAVLNKKPELISAAVHAFCNRDPVDAKVCKAMKYFPPEDRVYTTVNFTKCLYAMLVHSKFVPDRRTGWNLPSFNDKNFKSHNLGMKIACGFEILVSTAKPSADLENDKGWQNYLKSLKDKNYFNDLLEHSKDYNNLLNKAKEYFINHRDTMHYYPKMGQDILALTKNLDVNENTSIEDLPEDDDSWLNINPEELDKHLQEKYGRKKIHTFNNNSEASNFSQKLTSFLDHASDIEGVEFPNEPVRPPRKNKPQVSFSETSKPKIDFDPNAFGCAVQNILNFVIPDDEWNLESDSDMSDYEDDNFVKLETCVEKNEMEKYMAEMDKQLASTTLGESFVKKNGDAFEDIENFNPVDIDVNALKNILESYKSQLGESGPSSNMLGPMGIHLDVADDD